MFVFFLSFVFGILQVCLLKMMFGSIKQRKGIKTVLLFAVKFALYALAAALFMTRYVALYEYLICGYICALPIGAVVLFIYGFYSAEIKNLLLKTKKFIILIKELIIKLYNKIKNRGK